MSNKENQTQKSQVDKLIKTDKVSKPPKDLWDKMTSIGSILLPISLAIVGYKASSNLKSREINAEYFKLAVNILSNSEPNDSPEGMQLYAFNILKSLSPVPMPPDLEASLSGKSLSRDQYYSGGGFGGGCILRLESTDYEPIYIYVDDELKAITPVSIEVPEGDHKIGFHSKTGELIRDENIILNYNHLTYMKLDPKKNKLTISSIKKGHGVSGRW